MNIAGENIKSPRRVWIEGLGGEDLHFFYKLQSI